MTAQQPTTVDTYFLDYGAGPEDRFKLWRLIPKLRPAWYLAYLIWLLLLQVIAPLSLPYAWAIQLVYVAIGLLVTTGRISDAGFSRRWAVLVAPTLAAPWLFPILIDGGKPMGAVSQLMNAAAERNVLQFALAIGLVMVPFAVGFTPSQRPATASLAGRQ